MEANSEVNMGAASAVERKSAPELESRHTFSLEPVENVSAAGNYKY